jgi:hypothetical protein
VGSRRVGSMFPSQSSRFSSRRASNERSCSRSDSVIRSRGLSREVAVLLKLGAVGICGGARFGGVEQSTG